MEQPLIFKLKAGLESNGIALLNAPEVSADIASTTPPEFPGGQPGYWSPETLLLGSAVGCFLNTFQVFAQKMKLTFDSITCDADGRVERIDGKFQFTGITLYPTVMIQDPGQEAAVLGALDKAHRYCLISNSLKCPVEMEHTLLIASLVE